MRTTQKISLSQNNSIPFNQFVSNWANPDSTYQIQYNETNHTFTIPYASQSDYYILWDVSLSTIQGNTHPLIDLEFMYNNIINHNYSIYPLRTSLISNTCLYHVNDVSPNDNLSIQLKILGEQDSSFFLSSTSHLHITANIIILGL